MKKIITLNCLSLCLLGSGCSPMPKECQQSWKSIEEIARKSGIAEDAIQDQKKLFEQQIRDLGEQQAKESCKAQSTALGFVQ